MIEEDGGEERIQSTEIDGKITTQRSSAEVACVDQLIADMRTDAGLNPARAD